MNNFKMTLQYDGTRYLGWTKNEKSVKLSVINWSRFLRDCSDSL